MYAEKGTMISMSMSGVRRYQNLHRFFGLSHDNLSHCGSGWARSQSQRRLFFYRICARAAVEPFRLQRGVIIELIKNGAARRIVYGFAQTARLANRTMTHEPI